MSGARLVVTLLHELRRRGGRYGLATHVRRRRPGPGGAVRAGGVGREPGRGLHPARPAARAARRRARRRVLRPAGVERAGRRRASSPTRPSSSRRRDRLLAGLEDGWLRDQARGLRTYAGVLAGEGLSYSDEVERCYGVRPQRVGTEIYAAVHDELEELLPGDGTLGERYEDWRNDRFVADEKIVPAIRDVVGALRARHREARRPPGGGGARPRGGQRRAVVGVQLLPRRSPQPRRRQRRRAGHLRRPDRARRPRGLPRPSHGARGQGAAPHSRARRARGVDPAGADAGLLAPGRRRRDRAGRDPRRRAGGEADQGARAARARVRPGGAAEDARGRDGRCAGSASTRR